MSYESKAKVTKISATSRIAIKDKRTDCYYTVEYAEERELPDGEGVDLKAERDMLWDDVNGIVDHQAAEIYVLIKGEK